ncbi:MAG: hypothetical protein M1546_17290 [Chloroflexi bacterium]|nr:hypothetical protein [Chloroflexota bacterium]
MSEANNAGESPQYSNDQSLEQTQLSLLVQEQPEGHSFRQRTWRRRLLGGLVFVLFLCLLGAIVAASGYIGARAGSEELKARSTATTNAQLIQWFQNGLDLMNQGNYARAEANFEAILQHQPDNNGVLDLLATAIVGQTPTALPPTATPTPIITDKNELLSRMKDAYARQDWDTVINMANQLRALDSSFERVTVDEMRYQALVTRGLLRLDEGDVEAGLYDLDMAAAIQELDAQTESQRQMAALYQNALYYFGADWDKTITLLKQVYALSPGYRDVANKLFEAYERTGDAYAAMLDWCPAEARYTEAVGVFSSTMLDQKRIDAQQKCLTATPVGMSGTLSVQGVPGMVGQLIFAAVDTTSGAYQLHAYDSSSSQVSTIETGGSQPAYQRYANVTAFTLGGTVHGLYSNGMVGTLGNTGGAWPSVSPDGTRFAYSVYQDGNWNIYIASVDGSGAPVIITQGTYPVWGPTGRIAFQGCINGQCGIHTINPDQTSDIQRLTTSAGDTSIQWSPQGDELVYMTNFTGNWEIFAVSMGGQFRQLTNGTGTSAAPTWSPDGARVAFESNRDGNWGIYVMNKDGSDVRKLIDLGPNHSTWQTDRLAWTP